MLTDYIPYIHTPRTLTVHLMTQDVPLQITADHPNFQEVLDILTGMDNKDEDAVYELMQPVVKFKRIIGSDTHGFYLDNGQVTCKIDGYPLQLPSSLTEEVLRVHSQSGNLTPLFNFVSRLARNPDKEVIAELFEFIQSCGLAITQGGAFLAYKIVRSDFKDIYSGTMDNSPGSSVSMPRFAVEKDRERTCSAGLHFAAWDYLNSYGRKDRDKIVLLKIDPSDVVSIPSDYNNMKGRACSYHVLREIAMPEELKYHAVWTDEGQPYEYDEEDYYDEEEDDDDNYYD